MKEGVKERGGREKRVLERRERRKERAVEVSNKQGKQGEFVELRRTVRCQREGWIEKERGRALVDGT